MKSSPNKDRKFYAGRGQDEEGGHEKVCTNSEITFVQEVTPTEVMLRSKRKRAMDEAKTTKKIDWNDPSVIRYHTLKMKPKTIAQARRNMIKPIYEIVSGLSIKYVPMDAEHGSEKQESPAKEKSSEKIVDEEIDWKTCVLTETFMYYQVFRGDGSSKNYKVLSEMLEDFDRLDVEELFRLVKERYITSRPEGFDLMLWGDLHTLFEPDEEMNLRDQHE
ncbi:hypothetical protein Tco_0155464 [Tanacetum coccineum]